MKKITWLQDYTNERKDSVWYGGDIVKIETDRYIFTISAIGDVSIELDGEHFRDKGNTGYIGEVLKEHHITNDEELRKAEDRIMWWNNNWYEYTIWDKEKEDYIDNGYDTILDDTFDEDDIFDWVDDVIKSWEEWNKED